MQGQFAEFCRTPHTSLAELVKAWTPNLPEELQEWCSTAMIIVRYNAAKLESEESRSREYLAMYLRREHYGYAMEHAESDESLVYNLVDAETEIIQMTLDRKGETAHRKPDLIANQGEAVQYMYVGFDLEPLFNIREYSPTMADTLLNQYIYVQVAARGFAPSVAVKLYAKAIAYNAIGAPR